MDETKGHRTEQTEVGILSSSLPYVLPLAVPLLIAGLADWLPNGKPGLQVLKTLAMVVILGYYRRAYDEVRVRFGPPILTACLVGLALVAAWVWLDPYYPQCWAELALLCRSGLQTFPHAAKAASQFNPFVSGSMVSPLLAVGFRLVGAVILVPIVEELFFRSWLLRFMVKENFRTVPLGTFTWASFVWTTALFGLSHHEWLAGMLCGAAFSLLLYWRKDLFLCIVAHAAANLGLAAWVLSRGAWQFW